MANRLQLEEMVEAIIVERSTKEWDEIFTAADVPASAIFSVPEAVEHAHTRHRGMFPTMTHDVYGDVRVPGPPLQLGGASIDAPKAPPLLGEDTGPVLKKYLGLDDVAVADLERRGIVRSHTADREIAV